MAGPYLSLPYSIIYSSYTRVPTCHYYILLYIIDIAWSLYFVITIFKVIVAYDRAYWREGGFSGEVVGDGSEASLGPVFNVFDDSIPVH